MKNGNTSTHQESQGLNQNVRKRSDSLGNPFDARELMIDMEMEKKRIKEEIIRLGLLRRRELEAEAIREMMREGEIDPGSDGIGLSLKDYSLNTEVHGSGFGERQMGLSLSRQQHGENDGKMPVVDWAELGNEVLGSFPLQHDPNVVLANRIATKPIKDASKGQVISLAMPLDSDVSGIKRKPEAPITEFVDDTPSVKKLRKEWRCSLCQFIVGSEQDLKNHLEGRNHKAREKEWRCSLCQFTVRSEQDLKTHLAGRKHKAKEKAIAEIEKTANKCAGSTKAKEKAMAGTNKTANKNAEALAEEADYPNELETNDVNSVECGLKLKGELRIINDRARVSENEITTDPNVDFKFWCNTCKFGTNTEEEMTVHLMEERHVTLWCHS